MIIKRVREGEVIPWYYSRVYYDVCRMEMVVALIPFCYAVLVFYRIRDAWYRYHGRPTWIDDRIQEALLSVDPSRVTGDIFTVFNDYGNVLESMKINGRHSDAIKMLETCINAYSVPKDFYISSKETSKAFSKAIKLLNDFNDEVLDES